MRDLSNIGWAAVMIGGITFLVVVIRHFMKNVLPVLKRPLTGDHTPVTICVQTTHYIRPEDGEVVYRDPETGVEVISYPKRVRSSGISRRMNLRRSGFADPFTQFPN